MGLFAVLDHSVVLSGNGSSALSEQSALAATTPPKIAYTQSGFGGQLSGGLYVVNADGSGRRRLARAGHQTPAWSPDGKQIAFGGSVVNADGSGLQNLMRGGSPAWSPDGRRIAFKRYTDCCGRAASLRIYVINADGSGERKLTSRGEGARSGRPTGRRSRSRADG